MCSDRILAEFGVSIAPDGVLSVSNLDKAAGYIHHSREPVAATAFSLVSPALARRLLPDMTFSCLVNKRSHMDNHEAQALAKICGTEIPTYQHTALFSEHLDAVVAKFELDRLFGRYGASIQGIYCKPRGIHSDVKIKEKNIKIWRRLYRELAAEKKLLAATIIWLYRGCEDETWLDPKLCQWHAADAIGTLRKAGMLADWGKLVALYAGW